MMNSIGDLRLSNPELGESDMGFFNRFSANNTGEALQEIYEELGNMYHQIERIKREISSFRQIDQKLKQATTINQSAVMISQKLNETYRDVQLIQKSIQKDDQETCAYIRQQRKNIEDLIGQLHQKTGEIQEEIEKQMAGALDQHQEKFTDWVNEKQEEKQKQLDEHAKKILESLDQRQKEYEEKKEELDDKLKNLKETIEAEQKKWTENLAQLNKVILEKEEMWQQKSKRQTILFSILFLLSLALSAGALWF
jgi:chromosome segregation ATPase